MVEGRPLYTSVMCSVSLEYSYTFHKVDIRSMVLKLRNCGVTTPMIGQVLGVSLSTVQAWVTAGAKPRTIGVMFLLVDFAARYLSESEMNECGVEASHPLCDWFLPEQATVTFDRYGT